MKTGLSALVAGLLFGLGLSVSQMINPEKVIAFLDVAGDWDPSLAFVLLAAVVVSLLGYRLANRRNKPVFADRFRLPGNTRVDARLVGGAAIFGVGWGLAGYCPGPAVTALVLGTWEPVIFVVALLAGSLAQWAMDRVVANGRGPAPGATE